MSELCGRFADETKVDKALEVMQQVDDVKGIMGEAIQSLLNTQENLEVLEERGEVLKEQARTFQKTSRTVAQVQRRQNTKFLSYSCIILVVLIIVATVPLVLYYWADIVAFLSGALPPDGNWSDTSYSYDDASGEDSSSGATLEGNGTLDPSLARPG